ncbi:hypothetical protein [Streptomyces sp. enrichment culture]|uniref:hypothetical protein n=1 Tax=Streptomyces sp. enrichment culture TaxID=1795815 RepID=UPI003F565109
MSSTPAAARVDVETVLLCDVLPDGTVAGVALVEPVYDTVSGARVATRIVNPTTGAAYTPQGTLQPCGGTSTTLEVDHLQQLLCDTAADGTVTQFLRHWTVDNATGALTAAGDTALDGTTAYTPAGTVGVCPSNPDVFQHQEILCDAQTDGTQVRFIRKYVQDATGTVTATVDFDLTGAPYTPVGTIGACPAVSDCASPTEPVTTVGLCLADGTPIAVTVIRDCAGNVTSEGWLNLTTGAYSAGAPPAGTIACGDSRSIQVSGTFCDVDPATGDVLGLVLIEYTYDDTGAISSVRLVDAVTGGTYTPTGTITTCPAGVEQPERDVVQLCDTATDGTVTAFVRDYARDENGAITGHSDYLLDGTAYTPTGTVGVCSSPCLSCETLLLCDFGADNPATITGIASSGTLPDGTTWTATNPGNGQPMPSRYTNGDGAWWGLHVFPNPTTGPTRWTFSRPSTVEFSIYIPSSTPPINAVQLPAALEVVNLPDGYSYDSVTGVLTRTATGSTDPCTYVTDPQIETTARFRTPGPVTSYTTQPHQNSRIAACGTFITYWSGAIEVTPTGQFLRTICRDCDGAIASVTDTGLDGTTPYTPVGPVGMCGEQSSTDPAADAEPLLLCDTAADGTVTEFLRHYVYDAATGALTGHRDTALDGQTAYAPTGSVGQCQPATCELTPICVRPSGRVEFLSNPAGDTSGVDADWTWGQSLTGPWFPTYRVGVYPGWITADPGTAEGTAHWISPHPDSQLANTGQPGEGPAITAGTPDWYGRASFALPSFADPATIRISATALNADQLAVEWRLNGGAWQPVNSDHTQPPYTLAPTAVPGAQAGVNEIIVHVRETVFPTGAAGILLHVIAEYDVDASAYLQWTQVVCTDGAMYYLDEAGVRQDALPDGAEVVPCPGATDTCAKAVVERCGCDDTDGDGIGDVTYTELWAVDPCGGAAPELLGTYLDGDLTQPYTPVSPVECTAADVLPGPLSTGVRNVTGTAAQDIASAFPGLQSVTLTVLSGSVLTTMSNGASVTIPAGVTMTWSVAQDSDTALAAASFAGATAAANYLLNWTWK